MTKFKLFKPEYTDFYTYWRSLSPAAKKEAAIEIGSSTDYLRRIGVPSRNPVSPKMALKIESVTGVNKSYLRPDLWPLDE